MDHSQIDELISNMLKNGLIYDKPSKKGTSYFITEATHNDHEKAGDNTDVINIGNNNCFARGSNPPSPYKDTDCPTKESETITDLSTPQIEGGSFHVISTNPSYLTHMDFADILSSQCTHQEMKILKVLSSSHERFQNYDYLNYRPSSLDNKPLQFMAF